VHRARFAALTDQKPTPVSRPVTCFGVATGLIETVTGADDSASVVLPFTNIEPTTVEEIESSMSETLSNLTDVIHHDVELASPNRFPCAETKESPPSSTKASITGSLEILCQSESSANNPAVVEVTLSSLIDDTGKALSVLDKTISPPASNAVISICDQGGLDTTVCVASKSKLTAEDLDMVCDNDNDDISSNISTSSSVLSPFIDSPIIEGNQRRSRCGRALGTRLNRMSCPVI